MDAQAFVMEGHGADAHGRVLAAVDPETFQVFARPIKEDGWYPLRVLTVYLIAARRVLEPGSSDFFRREGFFTAQRRKAGALGVMVDTPELRMRLAPTAWRLFYDAGRLEVVGSNAIEATGRIHGFPATPELCERFVGIWEGISSGAGVRSRAEEFGCVLRGDPYCELKIRYAPAG